MTQLNKQITLKRLWVFWCFLLSVTCMQHFCSSIFSWWVQVIVVVCREQVTFVCNLKIHVTQPGTSFRLILKDCLQSICSLSASPLPSLLFVQLTTLKGHLKAHIQNMSGGWIVPKRLAEAYLFDPASIWVVQPHCRRSRKTPQPVWRRTLSAKVWASSWWIGWASWRGWRSAWLPVWPVRGRTSRMTPEPGRWSSSGPSGRTAAGSGPETAAPSLKACDSSLTYTFGSGSPVPFIKHGHTFLLSPTESFSRTVAACPPVPISLPTWAEFIQSGSGASSIGSSFYLLLPPAKCSQWGSVQLVWVSKSFSSCNPAVRLQPGLDRGIFCEASKLLGRETVAGRLHMLNVQLKNLHI